MDRPFQTLDEADRLAAVAAELSAVFFYYSNANNDWFFRENEYFAKAAHFIGKYRGVVVFVPT